VSVHLWGEMIAIRGPSRVDLLGSYRDLGISRVMGLDRSTATSDDALESLIEDARAAGIELNS
jgi:hypothetical protein